MLSDLLNAIGVVALAGAVVLLTISNGRLSQRVEKLEERESTD